MGYASFHSSDISQRCDFREMNDNTISKRFFDYTTMQPLKLIDRYTLLQRIAEGTYGEVYKARSNSTKQLVAVKRFKSSGKIGLPISFVREHYVLSFLSDRHIPRVLQVFPCEEPAALAMEWLSLSLQQVVKSKRKYSIKQTFLQIVQGLEYLHSCGVLHRDLKPGNIMLGAKVAGTQPLEVTPQNYWVKLIDFGMAREWREGDMTNQVGTLFYRAPELLVGEKRYDSKVDMWSLGCVFYFMQTGALLFKGSSDMDQLRSVVAVLGAEIGEIGNEKLRQGLVKMKMEGVQENWSLIDKHLNEIQFDLLKKMVTLQPERRLSCRELLYHPYFM